LGLRGRKNGGVKKKSAGSPILRKIPLAVKKEVSNRKTAGKEVFAGRQLVQGRREEIRISGNLAETWGGARPEFQAGTILLRWLKRGKGTIKSKGEKREKQTLGMMKKRR